MKLFFIRAFRAAKLDATVFDEFMETAKLMTQAIIVVFIYGAAVAYGSFARAGVAGINSAIFITLIGWYIWAFSIYIIGVRLFPETGTTADRKAFMRAMGFASSPGWLRFLGLVPETGGVVFAVISIWMPPSVRRSSGSDASISPRHSTSGMRWSPSWRGGTRSRPAACVTSSRPSPMPNRSGSCRNSRPIRASSFSSRTGGATDNVFPTR